MVTKKSVSKKKSTKSSTARVQSKPDVVESSISSSCSCGSCCGSSKSWTCKESGGCGYFLGFLGAAIYYISTATGFWSGVLGILKAIVWPVFVVIKLLSM